MGLLNFVWRLPAKILDSATSSLTSPWKKSHGSTRRPARRRPLHTCGASCLAMAKRAAAKAQDLDAPLGPMAKRSISVFHRFCPFARAAATRSLALLIVVDDRILAIEGKIEAVFPQSAHLFDRIDGVVRRAETLPENLDAALRKFPTVIHQFPLLDWVVARLISLLNFLLSTLIHLGSKGAREKEITVDVNCKTQDKSSASSNPKEHTKLVQFEQPYSYADAARNNNQGQIPKSVHFDETEVIKSVPTEVIHLSVRRLHSWKSRIKALEEPLSAGDSPMYSSYQSANSSPVSDCSQDENHHPFTYKEILEKEKEDDEEEEREEEEGVRVEEIREQVVQSN